MSRELAHRADDLAERLLICQLELQAARSFEKRLDAFSEFCQVVAQIERLQTEADEPLHRGHVLIKLNRKAAAIRCSKSYKLAAWFAIEAPAFHWMICTPVYGPCAPLQPR